MQEIVEKRSRTGKVFNLGNGKFRAEIGNHSHVLKNGLWLPTQTTIDSEAGTDSDTGLQYIAKSRSEFLDYDIKFGKNDPVWMKIKHIPTGKKVTFKPKNNRNRPDHTVVGNKISVSQAWDGIDMEIYVTDRGTKTNYIITSAAGQRVVEFDVAGDLSSAYISPAWYKEAGELSYVEVPRSFANGILSYDFQSVPIGTVVDPSVSFDLASAWSVCSESATENIGALVSGESPAFFSNYSTSYLSTGHRFLGADYLMKRSWRKFDCSSVPASATVSNAVLSVPGYGRRVGSDLGYDFVKAYSANDMTPGQNKATFQNVGSLISSAIAYVISETPQTLTIPISAEAVTPGSNTVICLRGYCDYSTQAIAYGSTYVFDADTPQGSTLAFDYTVASTGCSTNPAGKQYPFGLRGWR